jgi:hypothetical protein
MNKRLPFRLIAVALLTIILSITFYVAEPIEAAQSETETKKSDVTPVNIPKESVLHQIPENTLGVIYCPSLLELNERINFLAANMMPPAGPAPEFLAQILASSFGAGFESLAELEDIGLDLNRDFVVFLTSLDPPSLSATVHLTDPEAMKQVIETEAEGSAPTEYKGVTYWSSAEGSGSFAILDDTLVFSQQPEVCENVIDIRNGTLNSIAHNPDYALFLTKIIEGKDQVAAYFNLESIIAPFSVTLKEELRSNIGDLKNNPATMAAVPMYENMFNGMIEFIEELQSVSVTLQIEDTDVQLAPFLKLENDGKIQDILNKFTPDDLVLLNDLPNSAFINGGFQGNSRLLLDLNTSWLTALMSENTEQNEAFEKILQQMEEVYESMGDEFSFSVNFNDSIIPDYLVIYELKDEQKVKDYYDKHFLDNFNQMMQTMRDSMGELPQLAMYDGVYAGDPVMHNDVEIKTLIFPNFSAAFSEMPPEVAVLIPQEWTWSYAFSQGHLFFALGEPEIIKIALDSKVKIGESVADNEGYQRLIERLGSDNNLFFAISPLTAAKSIMSIVSKADPNIAAQMQMFTGILMGVPENYSIGFSAKVRDGGIGAKLLITFGDFKQLIQTFAVLSGMGQMQ